MASLKRNQKTQLMLNFTKRNVTVPEQTTQQLPKPAKTPLRPMPRPTAPPFFKAPLPKQPFLRNSSTITDDAWEAADRLMKGQRLTPKKRAFEDDAPALEDSDDDFESDIITQRTPKPRYSSVSKSSVPLRDDRTSMTKRSANKSKRSQPVGVILTQQRSVFEDCDLPPKMTSLSSSEDEDDDNHVVVFDGEKSSLSGTDNEDERGVDGIDLDTDLAESLPSEKGTGNESTHFREGELPLCDAKVDDCSVGEVDIDDFNAKPPHPDKHISLPPSSKENRLTSKHTTPSQETRPRQSDVKLSIPKQSSQSSKEKLSFLTEITPRTNSFRGLEPRTIGRQKCSAGSKDMFQTHAPEQGLRRRKEIRPLFNSDTDESGSEKFRCREGRYRGPLKPLIPASPSSDDGQEDKSRSRPSMRGAVSRGMDKLGEESERLGAGMDLQDVEFSDLEFVSTPKRPGKIKKTNTGSSKRKQCRSTESGDEEFEVGNIQHSNFESPMRTPRNKRNGSRGTDGRRNSISEYIRTASPSLSPPSRVKKRRRLQKLILTESSGDEQDSDSSGQSSILRKHGGKRRQNSADGTMPDTPSGTPKSAEWYHERNIDEFSESSCDIKPTPRRSYVTRAVTRRRRRQGLASPSTRRLLPVKRNISKSFDRSPDHSRSVGMPRRCPSTSQFQGSALHVRDSMNHNRAGVTQDVETEVIDLVDEDEEPEAASNGCNQSPQIDVSLSSGGDNKINSSEFDEDSPPPFNLIALCKDGESIREMKERLGEEFVMDKVTEAQKNGREIVGGEELGLNGSYNKSVFDEFSKTVVADQLGKERASKSVTEQALRGEYKFHYRGRQRDSTSGTQEGSSRGKSWGRFAKFRRRRGSS